MAQQKSTSPEIVITSIQEIFKLAQAGPISDEQRKKLDHDALSIIDKVLVPKQSEIFFKKLLGAEYKKSVKKLKLKSLSQIGTFNLTVKHRVTELYAMFFETDHRKKKISRLASFTDIVPTLQHLIAVVQAGQLEETEGLLDLNPSLLNGQDEDGASALFHAAHFGHLAIVELLLSKEGCKTRLSPYDKSTALHAAAGGGHTTIVEKLLDADLGLIDIQMDQGATALFFAAQAGHEDTVQLLLDKGCDPYWCSTLERNALHIAIEKGHIKIVTALLDKHAGLINTLSENGSALHYAANFNRPEIVDILLSKKCDPAIKAEYGRLALHVAANKGYTNIVSALAQQPPNLINDKDEAGMTPAYLALNAGHFETLEYLIEQKAEVNTATPDGWTLLHMAAQKGDKRSAAALLAADPDLLNKQTEKDITPLYVAATHGHIDLLKYLLEEKAKIDLCHKEDGTNALHAAVLHQHQNIVDELLLQHPDLASSTRKGGDTALTLAVGIGHIGITSALLQAAPDVPSAIPLLSLATMKAQPKMVEFLLEKQPSREHIIDAFKAAVTENQLPIIEILKKHVPDSKAWMEILKLTIGLGRSEILHQLLADKQIKLAREDVQNLLELARKAKSLNKGIFHLLSKKLQKFPKPKLLADATDFDSSTTSHVLAKLAPTQPLDTESLTEASDSKSVEQDIDKCITQAKEIYSEVPDIIGELAKAEKQRELFAAFVKSMFKSQKEKNRRYSTTWTQGLDKLRFTVQSEQRSDADKRKAELAELGYFEILDEKRTGNFFVKLDEDAMQQVPQEEALRIRAKLAEGTKFATPGLVLLEGSHRAHSIYELSLPKAKGRLIGPVSEKIIHLASGDITAHVITLCDYAQTHKGNQSINQRADLLDKALSRHATSFSQS